MKHGIHALAFVLGLGLVVPAFAQDDPAKQEPAKEEAAKPAAEKAPEAAPAKEEAAKPAAEAAPAAAPAKEEAAPAAAAPAAAPAKEEPPKELSSCAKTFVPLADSYKSSYDDMQKWIAQIDKDTAAASANLQKIQDQIKDNETATTQAKLSGDNAKAKDLQKANKKLWDDFNTAKKGVSDKCSQYVKEASQRVKQYSDAANKALEGLKAK